MKITESCYYDNFTWEEIKEIVRENRVVIIPVGTVEQHGKHLPLNTDNFLVEKVCNQVGKKISTEILIMPPVLYGLNIHHMDFPGTIAIEDITFINFMTDITKSVAFHGFRKILIVNGHGSNMIPLDLVVRRTNQQTKAYCAALTYPNVILDLLSDIRDSELGGICHAGELETSLYLYLNNTAVRKERIIKDLGYRNLSGTEYFYIDLEKSSPVTMIGWESSLTESGQIGDATVASSKKGENIFDLIIDRMIKIIREFRKYEEPERKDHH